MLIGAIHSTDLLWAVMSTAGALYPLYLLSAKHREPGARALMAVVALLGIYPWATAIFHLTPFDYGLSIAICLMSIPAYLSVILRAIDMHSRTLVGLQYGTLVAASLLAALAITNPWHGHFATFAAPVAGQPNHAISHGGEGIGMVLTHMLAFAAVGATLIMTGFNYSRARWGKIHVVSAFILPAAALGASLLVGAAVLKTLQVNPFYAATTTTLWVLTYAFAKRATVSAIQVSRSEIMTHMPDAMLIVDKNNKIIDFNPAFTRLFGGGRADIAGLPLSDFLPQVDTSSCMDLDPDPKDGGTQTFSVGEQHFELKIKLLQGYRCGHSTLIVVRDVTEGMHALQALQSSKSQLNAANAELVRISNTDPLTGLHNRRYFDERFAKALAAPSQAHRTALLLVDIDHFKRVNDGLGHQTGDQVLKELAQQMQIQCREGDVLARIGGEEFAVILSGINEQALPGIAERFHKHIQVYVEDAGVITTSIGATVALPHDSRDTMLARADAALYEAKHAGRNRVVVNELQQPPQMAVVHSI